MYLQFRVEENKVREKDLKGEQYPHSIFLPSQISKKSVKISSHVLQLFLWYPSYLQSTLFITKPFSVFIESKYFFLLCPFFLMHMCIFDMIAFILYCNNDFKWTNVQIITLDFFSSFRFQNVQCLYLETNNSIRIQG